jgi:hypothetical protein
LVTGAPILANIILAPKNLPRISNFQKALDTGAPLNPEYYTCLIILLRMNTPAYLAPSSITETVTTVMNN